jgi:hypothetical protein
MTLREHPLSANLQKTGGPCSSSIDSHKHNPGSYRRRKVESYHIR